MIKTPSKPTKSAVQRQTPTYSPKKNAENPVINSGAIKKIAEASASGKAAKRLARAKYGATGGGLKTWFLRAPLARKGTK